MRFTFFFSPILSSLCIRNQPTVIDHRFCDVSFQAISIGSQSASCSATYCGCSNPQAKTEEDGHKNKGDMQAAGGGLRTLARRLARGFPRLPVTTTTQHVREMSMELRPREKKLLEEFESDPALKAFKSDKGKTEFIKRFGDVLVIAVVAGSTYEIYYRVMERKAAHAEESIKEE